MSASDHLRIRYEFFFIVLFIAHRRETVFVVFTNSLWKPRKGREGKGVGIDFYQFYDMQIWKKKHFSKICVKSKRKHTYKLITRKGVSFGFNLIYLIHFYFGIDSVNVKQKCKMDFSDQVCF